MNKQIKITLVAMLSAVLMNGIYQSNNNLIQNDTTETIKSTSIEQDRNQERSITIGDPHISKLEYTGAGYEGSNPVNYFTVETENANVLLHNFHIEVGYNFLYWNENKAVYQVHEYKDTFTLTSSPMDIYVSRFITAPYIGQYDHPYQVWMYANLIDDELIGDDKVVDTVYWDWDGHIFPAATSTHGTFLIGYRKDTQSRPTIRFNRFEIENNIDGDEVALVDVVMNDDAEVFTEIDKQAKIIFDHDKDGEYEIYDDYDVIYHDPEAMEYILAYPIGHSIHDHAHEEGFFYYLGQASYFSGDVANYQGMYILQEGNGFSGIRPILKRIKLEEVGPDAIQASIVMYTSEPVGDEEGEYVEMIFKDSQGNEHHSEKGTYSNTGSWSTNRLTIYGLDENTVYTPYKIRVNYGTNPALQEHYDIEIEDLLYPVTTGDFIDFQYTVINNEIKAEVHFDATLRPNTKLEVNNSKYGTIYKGDYTPIVYFNEEYEPGTEYECIMHFSDGTSHTEKFIV